VVVPEEMLGYCENGRTWCFFTCDDGTYSYVREENLVVFLPVNIDGIYVREDR